MKKIEYVIFGIRASIGIALAAISAVFLNFGDITQVLQFGLMNFVVILTAIHCLICIRKNKNYAVIKGILIYLLVALSITSAVFCDGGWFLLGSGIWSIIFCFIARPFSKSSALFVCCKYIAERFCNICNVGYKGKSPINYGSKILEIFIQLLLLPISAFIQIWCIPYGIIYGHYVGGFITRGLIFCGLKKEPMGKGYSYNVGASDKTVNRTITNKVRDSSGNIIGTYDQTVTEVVHDDGERYEFSDQFQQARNISFAALPLRILSCILSIFALFIPHLYISVRKPKTNCRYNYFAFRYFDVLILE